MLFKPGQTDSCELESSVVFTLWTIIDTVAVCCEAGEEWRRLTTTDKAPYELRAEEERRKYEQAMKEYNMVSIVSFVLVLLSSFAIIKVAYVISLS